MLPRNNLPHDAFGETDRSSGLVTPFTHPEEVLQSRDLNVAEKRALLASWASDTHAVPDRPALRQLDSGAIVAIDTVLAALRALDASEGKLRASPPVAGFRKPRLAFLSQWRRPPHRRDGDDDDPPPPCPAAALPPGVELELRRRRDRAWRLAAA